MLGSGVELVDPHGAVETACQRETREGKVMWFSYMISGHTIMSEISYC